MAENFRRRSLFPQTLAKSLEQAVKPIFKKHGFAEHRILTEWHAIVGQELASYSIPQKLVVPSKNKEAGTLHIIVAAGRALELQHMQPVILEKIAAYFGYSAVSRLVFTQSMTPLFQRKKREPVQKEGAPDKRLLAMVAECEDAELRAALLSLCNALPTVDNS
jgi:hypothetical protein